PVLAGRMDREGPFGWNGGSKDLATHIATTIQHNLGGSGLPLSEIEDLIVYLRRMQGAQGSQRSAEVDRGAALFESPSTGCTTCHRDGGRSTDSELHVLGGTRRSAGFLTPPLVGLGRSAPYFHDGRYAKLEDLLAKTDGLMGSTRFLSADDRAALVAYLQSL